MKEVSKNDRLSVKQKDLLNDADLATAININVQYQYKNSASEIPSNHTMQVSLMIVPDIEAEYVGGFEQLSKYIKETVINKISGTTAGQLQDANAKVLFTVNETGEIINAKISKTSGDIKTDQLLVEAIFKMPKWRPAENSKGLKVQQEFEFSVGNGGC